MPEDRPGTMAGDFWVRKARRRESFAAIAGELSVDGIKVHKLAVREPPRSGKPEELLAKYGINANAIVAKVKILA